MKQFPPQNKILFLLIICICTLPFIFYFKTMVLQSDISYLIDPVRFLNENIFLWNQDKFGSTHNANLWISFPIIIIHILFIKILGLPPSIFETIFFSFLLLIGFLSLRGLLKQLFHFDSRNYISYIIPSLFFIYNVYLISFLANSYLLIIPHVFLPLQLLLFIKILQSERSAVKVFSLALINALVFGVNPIFGVISLLLLFAYGLWSVVFQKLFSWSKFIKHFTLQLFLTILLIFWWLLPTIITTIADQNSSNYILKSESFYNIDSSPAKVFRGLGNWSFFGGHSGIPYLNFSGNYNNTILVVSNFVIIIIALLVILSIKKYKISLNEKKIILFFSFLIVILLPIVGGTNIHWPTSQIFQWMFDNIPYASAFRNTYKFMSVIILCLAIFLFVFLRYSAFQKDKIKKIIYSSLIAMSILISSYPLWTGNLFETSDQLKKVPDNWGLMADYINTNLKTSENRILLLPDQYFEVFDWNGDSKTIPGGLSNALFNIPVVHNTCIGCSAYLASLTNEYVYNNISLVNLEKLMGLLNISHILQRNDYDFNYYKVESPSMVKSILENYPNTLISKSIGDLDLYSLDPDFVYPRIYSPNLIYEVTSYDEIVEFLNKNHENTRLSFQIQNQIEENKFDIDINFYQRFFNENSINFTATDITQAINIPKSGEYKVTNDKTKFADLIINDKKISSNDTLLLEEGINTFKLPLKKSQINSISNGSFEIGLWDKKVSNCRLRNENAELGMLLIETGSENGKVLQLSAESDVACTSKELINPLPFKTYYISFDFKILSGEYASFCVWNGSECIKTANVKGDHNEWEKYEGLFTTDDSDEELLLYLYASAESGNFSQINYDNILINEIKNNSLESYIVSNVKKKSLNPIKITYEGINPTLYHLDARFEGAGMVIFQDSFHGGWKAYVRNDDVKYNFFLKKPGYSIPNENHFVANGFANGWWIDPDTFPEEYKNVDGNYEIVIEFWPQRWFYLGLLISGVTLLGCVGYLAYDWQKRRKLITTKTDSHENN